MDKETTTANSDSQNRDPFAKALFSKLPAVYTKYTMDRHYEGSS